MVKGEGWQLAEKIASNHLNEIRICLQLPSKKRIFHLMKLHTIRGGSKEALENKEYTIGVGISLGNKWFTPEKVVEQIQWALPYTKDKVVVFVADAIHAFNLEARSSKSAAVSKRRAIKQGTEMLEAVRAHAEATLSPAEQKNIVYAHWDDMADEAYREKVAYGYKLFEQSPAFCARVFELVEDHLKRAPYPFINEEKKQKLAQYIIEELPVCVCRLPIKNIPVDAYAYPHDSPMTEFWGRLQTGEEFPEVKENILDTEPRVFLEVR